MKKWLLFGGGVLTGIVLTFVVAFLISLGKKGNDNVTWFDQPTETIGCTSFKVFQVIDGNAALVREGGDFLSFGAVYLLTNDEGKYYYDDEVVAVPKGMVAKQVGIYKYDTKAEVKKTVPIIKIMKK